MGNTTPIFVLEDYMADNNIFQAFGFELKKVSKQQEENPKAPSIVPRVDEDGAGYVLRLVLTSVNMLT